MRQQKRDCAAYSGLPVPAGGAVPDMSASGTPRAARPVRETLRLYVQLMRLDRPVGIWLLLWPTAWALWLAAGGVPPLSLLVIFGAGTVLMRSAGCVINDIADRDFDPHVARTRERPLAAGRLEVGEAVRLFVVLCLMAFGLVARTNPLTLALAVPALLLAASYPFAKRFHAMPQAHLGLAFAWGIPMAFAAVDGRVDWRPASQLMLATVCWAIAYDTLYALVDRDDDLKIGVKSSAILFGRYALPAVGLFHGATLAVLSWLGAEQGLGEAWFAGLAVAGLLMARQLWLAHRDGAPGCFRGFIENQYVGGVIFLGLLVALW